MQISVLQKNRQSTPPWWVNTRIAWEVNSQVARNFYNTEVDIKIVREEWEIDANLVVFWLEFDNAAFGVCFKS